MPPDPPLLLIAGAALSSMLVVGLLAGFAIYALRYSPRARLKRRLATLVATGASGRQTGADANAGNPRRKLIQAKLKELEESQRKSRRRHQIRQLLMQAGLELTVAQYYMISALVAVLLTGAYLATGFAPIGAVLVAIPGFFLIPKWGVGFVAKRRRGKFTALFADAVDVIVRGIKSGLPVGECLNIIARESSEPVAGEFRLLTEGQRLGLTLDEALNRALERMPTPELKFFAIVLNIQQQTGGNLAETLGNLSRVLRERKKMADKVKAMSSEARSTAMIIGSLPFIMCGLLFLTSPDYIILLFTDKLGHVLVGVGVVMMALGTFIMKKMISFEI